MRDTKAISAIEVTEVGYLRWRSEYGGLKGDQVRRQKSLETEDLRLRRAVSDLTSEADPERGSPGAKRAAPAERLSPARRRACVDHVVAEHGREGLTVPARRPNLAATRSQVPYSLQAGRTAAFSTTTVSTISAGS